MFGECHAHIFLNGRNYKEAVALHKNHVSEEAIRQAFAEYRKRGITFVRDGGDALHVSEYASKIAPQYGIDYRSPMFAIHRKGHYGRIDRTQIIFLIIVVHQLDHNFCICLTVKSIAMF